MNAADIKPYVDLVTWPLVTAFAGLLFLPAIYLLVFRLNSLAIGDVKAELTQRQAKQIENQVEQDAEDASEDEPVKPEQVAQNTQDLADEDTVDKKEMYKNIIQAWTNLSIIVRALALPHGGRKSLKSFVHNVEVLRTRGIVTRDECNRLALMHEERFRLRDHPNELTQQSYRSYIRRAGRLAGRLTRLTSGFKAFGSSESVSGAESRPN
ncbi:MAG: hypothetical protein R3C31_07870 [Hyphomonadaceae bacterium]